MTGIKVEDISSDESETEEPQAKRKRGKGNKYNIECKFNTFEEAKQHISNSKYKWRLTGNKSGGAIYYKCSYCPMCTYIYTNQQDLTATVYITEGDHKHEEYKQRAINIETREAIDKLYDSG